MVKMGHSLVKSAEVWQQQISRCQHLGQQYLAGNWIHDKEWNDIFCWSMDKTQLQAPDIPIQAVREAVCQISGPSSHHFSPKSSGIVCKATIVSFLLMRSLVHSSWHCSQATYAEHITRSDSLGAWATVPQHFQLQNVQKLIRNTCTHLMWGSEV